MRAGAASWVILGSALASPLPAQTPAPGPAVRFSGYLQGRETYQQGVGLTATLNRARLTTTGTLPGSIAWRLQGEFRTGSVGTGRASVSLQDAYVRWTRGGLGLQVGQFKTPFTREFLTPLPEVETADRSTVVDSLAPKRDIGLMADYAVGGRGTAALGVFNGNGQNVTSNPDSNVLAIARVTYRPIPFLVLGANGAHYFAGADSTRYGVDLSIEAPWGIVRGEYVGQHRQGTSSGDDRGWYLLGAAPVQPWLQPIAKYEWFNRPIVARDAQKNRAWTLGVNLFPWGRTTRFTLEYITRKVGVPGTRAGTGLAQAQVVF